MNRYIHNLIVGMSESIFDFFSVVCKIKNRDSLIKITSIEMGKILKGVHLHQPLENSYLHIPYIEFTKKKLAELREDLNALLTFKDLISANTLSYVILILDKVRYLERNSTQNFEDMSFLAFGADIPFYAYQMNNELSDKKLILYKSNFYHSRHHEMLKKKFIDK